MKQFISIVIFALLISFGNAQTGITFPELTGENLNRENVTVPKDCIGKKTILCLASSKKAEEDLLTWQQPMYDKFIAKVGMFDSDYDVRLYFIPMFTGINQPAYEKAMKKLKEDHQQPLFDYVLLFKGDIKTYESTLKMSDDSKPYFFVLDEKGKVLSSTSGAFSEKKMEEIENNL